MRYLRKVTYTLFLTFLEMSGLFYSEVFCSINSYVTSKQFILHSALLMWHFVLLISCSLTLSYPFFPVCFSLLLHSYKFPSKKPNVIISVQVYDYVKERINWNLYFKWSICFQCISSLTSNSFFYAAFGQGHKETRCYNKYVHLSG